MFLAATWRVEVPCGVALDEAALGSVTGRDDHTGSVPADCAYNMTTPGQVVAWNCPQGILPPPFDDAVAPTDTDLEEDQNPLIIECIVCTEGSYDAGTPPEFGLSGYKQNGTFNCNNWKRVGKCQPNGTCGEFRTMQFCNAQVVTFDSQL